MLVAALLLSGCVEQSSINENPEDQLLFWPPDELSAFQNNPYAYSFCQPESAIDDSICGGINETTIEPIWGYPPYSFSLESGNDVLPPGLSLASNGLLTGIPTELGSYVFGVCASDSKNQVCRPTTLTVTLKTLIPDENADENVSPDLPEIFEIKINSLTCNWAIKTGAYNVKSDCVQIISTGTAQGPVGSRVELPILSWSDDLFDCGDWTLKPGALIAVGSSCTRLEGQPNSTNWNVDTEGNECPAKNYFNNNRTYKVKIYKDNELQSKQEAEQSVVCQ